MLHGLRIGWFINRVCATEARGKKVIDGVRRRDSAAPNIIV